jgi:hypothetical protein
MSEELFYCSCCGQCCRKIKTAVDNFKKLCEIYPDLYEEFPYSWSSSGVCNMLDDNNRCKCYENRPLICDSGRMLKKLQEHGLDINREDFITISLSSCKYLQGYPIKCSEKTWKIKRK